MKPNKKQIKQMRGLGHHLQPLVWIGKNGASKAVHQELKLQLDSQELVKVRIHGMDRLERNLLLDQVVQQSRSTLVQNLGNTAILYRKTQKGDGNPVLRKILACYN